MRKGVRQSLMMKLRSGKIRSIDLKRRHMPSFAKSTENASSESVGLLSAAPSFVGSIRGSS